MDSDDVKPTCQISSETEDFSSWPLRQPPCPANIYFNIAAHTLMKSLAPKVFNSLAIFPSRYLQQLAAEAR